jgi:hypothetical protein
MSSFLENSNFPDMKIDNEPEWGKTEQFNLKTLQEKLSAFYKRFAEICGDALP